MIDSTLPYGNELVVAVFSRFDAKSTFRITDENSIVRAFADAASDPVFKILFRNYPFDRDGIFPDSEPIRTAIETLQQTSLVGRQNPYLVEYTISPAVKVRYQKYIQPKLADQEPLIAQLAQRIGAALEIQEPAVAHAV